MAGYGGLKNKQLQEKYKTPPDLIKNNIQDSISRDDQINV